MGHHHDRFSAEEVLMIACLVTSISLITISSNINMQPSPEPPVMRIQLVAVPANGPVTRPTAGGQSSNTFSASPALYADDTDAALTDVMAIAQQDISDSLKPPLADQDFILDTNFSHAVRSRAGDNTGTRRGGDIRILKGIYVNGARAGALHVTVTERGELFVDGAELKELLDKPGSEALKLYMGDLGNRLVSFRILRERGFNLRYSTDDDAFMITS